MPTKPFFENFTEYWYYARYLSSEQRKVIFKNLPPDQKKSLDESYIKDKWSDLFYRNKIDEIIDELKKSYNYDLLDIRAKALKGRSVYVPSKFWKVVEEQMGQYKTEIVNFVMSGIKCKPCKQNPEVCLVVHESFDTSDS